MYYLRRIVCTCFLFPGNVYITLAIVAFILSKNAVYTKNHGTFKRLLGKNEIPGSYVLEDVLGTGSAFQCIGHCRSENQCWSIGYRRDGDICRLISTILDESTVGGNDLGWIYFVLTGTCLNIGAVTHGSCYYFGDNVMRTFDESQAICNNKGSYLVNIDDSAENEFILNIVTKRDIETWIGCSDAEEEGTWVWLPSKTPLTYTAWRPGQPDGMESQNCVIFHKGHNSNYSWHDCPCDRKCSVMCENIWI